MLMLTKDKAVTEQNLIFLTNSMYNALNGFDIKLDCYKKLQVLIENMNELDLIAYIVLQSAVADKMKVEFNVNTFLDWTGYDESKSVFKSKLDKALVLLKEDNIIEELTNSKFFYFKPNSGFLIIIGSNQEINDVSLIPLRSKLFGESVLETFYRVFGYTAVHSNDILDNKPNSFSMKNILLLLTKDN